MTDLVNITPAPQWSESEQDKACWPAYTPEAPITAESITAKAMVATEQAQLLKTAMANEITGGLSNPSKMPCKSYGTPASACIVGSKLRQIKGSVCSKCYAHKGMYAFPNVQECQAKRLRSITDARWTGAMVKLISGQRKPDKFFRWHDSGDIQSLAHLADIVAIAIALPDYKFWCPTRESRIVQQFMAIMPLPANLTVRVSASMIDGIAPVELTGTASAVHSTASPQAGHTACIAPSQNGECRECRACWMRSVKVVSYHQH